MNTPSTGEQSSHAGVQPRSKSPQRPTYSVTEPGAHHHRTTEMLALLLAASLASESTPSPAEALVHSYTVQHFNRRRGS